MYYHAYLWSKYKIFNHVKKLNLIPEDGILDIKNFSKKLYNDKKLY